MILAGVGAAGRTVLALVGFAARRLRSNPIHALTTLLGLSLTVGVVTAVPLYAEGMSTRLLREHLRASPGPLDLGVVIEHGEAQLPDDSTTSPGGLSAGRPDSLGEAVSPPISASPPEAVVRLIRSDNRHLLFTSDDPDAPLREGTALGRAGRDHRAGREHSRCWKAARPPMQVYTLRLPSGALAPLVEAVAATDMLDAEGLLVGDQVQLRFGDPRALDTPQAVVAVDIVGRFAPIDGRHRAYWPEDVEELTEEHALHAAGRVSSTVCWRAIPRCPIRGSWTVRCGSRRWTVSRCRHPPPVGRTRASSPCARLPSGCCHSWA